MSESCKVYIKQGDDTEGGAWAYFVYLWPGATVADIPEKAKGSDYFGELTLHPNEEWELSSIPKANAVGSICVADYPGQAGKRVGLEEAAERAIKLPQTFSKFQMWMQKSEPVYRRNAEGNVVCDIRFAHTPDEEGAKLPDKKDWEKVKGFASVKEFDPRAIIRFEVQRAMNHAGFHISALEQPLKEEKDQVYVFFPASDLGPEERDGEWVWKVAFTHDMLGENLPVWFTRRNRYGGYPERSSDQDWDVPAIKQELKSKPYVIGQLRGKVPQAPPVEKFWKRATPENKTEGDQSITDSVFESLYKKQPPR